MWFGLPTIRPVECDSASQRDHPSLANRDNTALLCALSVGDGRQCCIWNEQTNSNCSFLP